MTKTERKKLQKLLNKTGGLLEPDGLTGRNTKRAISDARRLAGLPVRGGGDDALLAWLKAQPDPSPDLPTEGVTAIARDEVGSRDYYEKTAAKPHWPGGASGVTIGVGYDLRFSVQIFKTDWADKLTPEAFDALSPHLGKQGSKAKADKLSWIVVPWTTSWQVFIARSLPSYVNRTRRAFPGFDDLPGLCRSVLVSLVFNRGASFTDTSNKNRLEMRNIRDHIAAGDLAAVADEILSMRRLWSNNTGLPARREREAKMWKQGLRNR